MTTFWDYLHDFGGGEAIDSLYVASYVALNSLIVKAGLELLIPSFFISQVLGLQAVPLCLFKLLF